MRIGTVVGFMALLSVAAFAGFGVFIAREKSHNLVDGRLFLASDLGALRAHHARTGVWVTSRSDLTVDDERDLAPALRAVRHKPGLWWPLRVRRADDERIELSVGGFFNTHELVDVGGDCRFTGVTP